MKKHLTLILLMALAAITANAQTQHQADSLYNLGRELVNTGKGVEGRPVAQQAMEMYKTLHGEASDDYINALNVYAASFNQENNYQKAAEIEQQVLNLCEKLDHQHPRIGLFYENMGFYSYMIDDYPNGTKYWELALPYEEKYSDKYVHMIQGMAMMYQAMSNTEGVARMMQLIDDHNKHELERDCEDLKCWIERAQYYMGIGENVQAKDCFLQATNIAEGEEKIMVFEAYGQFLAMYMKDYTAGAEYTLSAARMSKTLTGVDESYAKLMNSAGLFSIFGKEYQQAVECYESVITFYRQFDTPAAKGNVAKCQKNLGNAYSGLEDYAKAIECYRQVVDYYDTYDKENEEYPNVILLLAKAEKFNKDYEASIAHHLQAMELFEARGMMEEYSEAANSLQLCYIYAGIEAEVDTKEDIVKAQRNAKLDEIINEELSSLQLTHDYLGELIYARSLGTIAGCYHLKEDYAHSIEYYNQYMTAIRTALKSEFSMQSEDERMATWAEEKNEMNELKEMLVTLPVGNESFMDDLSALVYDVALLSKGILLNSSIAFEKVLAEQANPELQAIYDQTKDNNAEMERLRKEVQTEDDLDRIVSLSQENQSLYLQLYKGCKELADFTDYISYDWKAVQQALEPTDIAIEFVSINPVVSNADDIMVALVLTKDMKVPIAVTIWNNEKLMRCDETEAYQQIQADIISHVINQNCDINYLKSLLSNPELQKSPCKSEISLYLQCMITEKEANADYLPMPMIGQMEYNKLLDNNILYESSDAGILIWNPINQYLDGKKRIFFSADGCLNHIGIEYLLYNGKPLSEQFEVYRLSSTKELCMHRQGRPLQYVALFGDINYDEKATLSENTETDLLALRGVDSQFDPLKSTKKEMDDIEAILKRSSVTLTKLVQTEASQTAFLRLSGSQVNLIHVATHGAYLASDKQTEEESMQNSILAFAGANDYEVTHDGILTAADIAKMNLRQCDLVVLSACETGLGKLGDDGVFGLQRGFKNAGVHTLMMSTKKVYDNTTATLMVNFYRHLNEGLSKREALVKAQQEVRESGFADAKYWATFILLDALE